jgi:hypothetical protein
MLLRAVGYGLCRGRVLAPMRQSELKILMLWTPRYRRRNWAA